MYFLCYLCFIKFLNVFDFLFNMGLKKIIPSEEFKNNFKVYELVIKKSVFIVPTDTIYGLSCNALHSETVKRLRKIKKQKSRPLSVIAPSKQWIKKNCVIDSDAEKWLNKLPGPYTLILPLKNKSAVAKEVYLDSDSLGVRMPDHWVSNFANKLNVPLITTSANIAGTNFMTCLNDLDDYLEKQVDFIVDEGVCKGRPSTLVHLKDDSEKIIKR